MFKAILVLLVLAFTLRLLFIFQGGVSFHYDMARDAFEAEKIWKYSHLKILGPPTSTPGLFHGVFYYYLIAPFYMIGQGDPRVVAIFLSLLNSLVIIPLFLLAKDLLKSSKWAFLAGFFYVISFEATQYASWISNPAPAVFTMAWFFYFLRLWQKGHLYGLYLAVFSAALSTQFQFFLIYLLVLISLFGIIFKIKTTFKEVSISAIVALVTFANFFVAAVKFGTLTNIFSGFLNIAAATQIDFRPQFSEVLINYINRLSELFTFNFFPTNVFLGGVLTAVVVYSIRKELLLLFYLFSNIPIFIFGGHSNAYANIGLAAPAILSLVYLLKKIWSKSRILVFVIVFASFLSGINAIFKYNPEGQVILVIPNDMNLKNELRLIDETYRVAAGEPFSINSVTLPFWTNTTWAYLYQWYGKNKYGYVPAFYGHDQVGLLGVESLQKIDKPLKKTFLILEPADGIPANFYQQELDSENAKTNLTKEINFSSIKLQIRVPKND